MSTTIKDVAEKADVSIATVSNVLNGSNYVSEGLVKRVKEAVNELNYQPNEAARSLKTTKTQTIGLVVSDISNPFFSTLVRGAEDKALEKGYSIIICNTDETLPKEELYVDLLRRKQVDGLIVAPTGKSDKNIEMLVQEDIPFVFVDRNIKEIQAIYIKSKNIEGAYNAINYLIENGHRRIGIIVSLEGVSAVKERFKGYRKALKENNISEDEEIIKRRNRSKFEEAFQSTKELVSLKNRPTAIFSTNGVMTLGTINALNEEGLRYPDDISIVGFDDFKWFEGFNPPITTVSQQPYKLGSIAVEALFNYMDDKKIYTRAIDTELKVRNSVKKL